MKLTYKQTYANPHQPSEVWNHAGMINSKTYISIQYNYPEILQVVKSIIKMKFKTFVKVNIYEGMLESQNYLHLPHHRKGLELAQ